MSHRSRRTRSYFSSEQQRKFNSLIKLFHRIWITCRLFTVGDRGPHDDSSRAGRCAPPF